MCAREVFNYEGADVRTILVDGVPSFSAVDVCSVLGIANTTDAIRRLDEDERTLVSIEGKSLNAVSEAGLFSLILGSRKPEAARSSAECTRCARPFAAPGRTSWRRRSS
ncbi:MAG: hypothetical protein CVT61_16000 [Actinobacteria bacterium HGW-Actinobacteria-11]|nr:MAG: hypothetical protein CVT61_16000 [Actinobacteria bacterium HGW-Actinobacteria-11]